MKINKCFVTWHTEALALLGALRLAMRPAVCGRWSQSPVLPGLWPRGLWDRVEVWERHLANSGETVREGKVCFCIQRFNRFGEERPKWEDQGEFLETPRVG